MTMTMTKMTMKGDEARARQETRVSSPLFLRSLLEVRHYSNDTLVSSPPPLPLSLPSLPLIVPFSWIAGWRAAIFKWPS